MAATFSWAQYTGSTGNSTTPGGSTIMATSSNTAMSWDFETADNTGSQTYTANPVSAGSASYPVWLKGYWSNTVGYTISNIKFWQFNPAASSANTASFTIFGKEQTAYSIATSTASGSQYASNSAMTAHTQSTASPTQALTNLQASFSASNNSVVMPTYLCLQLSAAANAPAGTSGYFGFTLQYDEQ